MRVIGGKFRSRKLKFPKTRDIRPATDRLKETIFNVLGQDLSGLAVLDIYAGMGSLGIESLSRGAARATFIDQSPLAIQYITENLKNLGLESQATVLKSDALLAIPRLFKGQEGSIPAPKYDIAFIDPPYNKGLVKKSLLMVEQFDILSPHGTIVVEHARQEELPLLGKYILERTNHYGITCLSFLHKIT